MATKYMHVTRELKPKTLKARQCVVSKKEDDGSFWYVHGVWVPNSARVWTKATATQGEWMSDEILAWFWSKIEETVENSKTSWRQDGGN